MKIILGSSSKGRREALESAGYTFDIVAPDIDEKAIRSNDPREIPILIARAKAEALKEKVTEPSIVVVGDQVVMCNENLQEKPESDDDVRLFFSRYNEGYPAETVSAVIVFNTENGKQAEGVDIAKVYFKNVPDEIIEEYIESKGPFIHAGAFAHEDDILKPYIDKLEGTPDSIKGLPINLMEELIKKVQ